MNLTRRIIAVGLSASVAIVLGILSFKGSDVALASLTSLGMLVIGFYFGDAKK
jgi:hypothetical protein